MRKAYTTSRFDRRLVVFLKSHPDLSEHVKVTLDRIISNPFDQGLRTHMLSGALKECFASNIAHKYRIIFLLNDEEIRFVDIGSHDEVY